MVNKFRDFSILKDLLNFREKNIGEKVNELGKSRLLIHAPRDKIYHPRKFSAIQYMEPTTIEQLYIETTIFSINSKKLTPITCKYMTM